MLLSFLRKQNFQISCYVCRSFLKTTNICRPLKPVHALRLLKANNIQYQSIKNEFCEILEKKAPMYFFMDKKSLNPFPMLISKSQINKYKQIHEALCYAIQTIVLNYFKDKRIEKALNLNNQAKNILELYRNKSFYQIGSYRYVNILVIFKF